MGSLLVLQIGAITKWQWTIHTLQHNSKPTMVSTTLRNTKIMSCIVNCFCLWTFTFRCTSKKQRFHKKFKKRRSKKIEKEQKGQSGKTTRKRKQIHSHGKSKRFKKTKINESVCHQHKTFWLCIGYCLTLFKEQGSQHFAST